MAQDESYQTKVYHKRPGDDYEVGSGGDLIIESGGRIKALSGASMLCSAAFDFFIASETFFTDRMRNFLMGRGAWSVIVGSTGGTISENIGGVAAVGASDPPITPSRMGYIVFSLVNADTYSARLHSAYSGEELVIILRGEAGNTVSMILRASTTASDEATRHLAGVSVIGASKGSTLSSILLFASADSRAILRMVGIDDGTWAVVDSGQSTGNGNEVVEQGMG